MTEDHLKLQGEFLVDSVTCKGKLK